MNAKEAKDLQSNAEYKALDNQLFHIECQAKEGESHRYWYAGSMDKKQIKFIVSELQDLGFKVSKIWFDSWLLRQPVFKIQW